MSKTYDVAAYVWPSYTGDELRTRIFWPGGFGEWETVIKAKACYEGHEWPRKPVWGYQNEADRYVMQMQIDAAADHGVNVFIYDWYWYDRRPFLENCLNDGYLKAKNNDRVKFYLMWANHDVSYMWDTRLAGTKSETVMWQGSVDRAEFERMANRLIEKYFHHPSYYKIDGKPVLSVFDLSTLVRGFGSVDATTDALQWLQKRCVESGLGGLHLQICTGKVDGKMRTPDGERAPALPVIKQLPFDSITHYQWCQFVDIDRDYNEITPDAVAEWKKFDEQFEIPYFASVSLGWDNNPRYPQFQKGVVKNNTPEAIRTAMMEARNYADAHPDQPPLIVVNSWNEWTETSYLQPDDLYGYGYLEAMKRVFVDQDDA